MKRISIVRKFVFALIVLMLVLVGLEIGLRIIGTAHMRQYHQSFGNLKGPTILCLGDSFTYGIGAGPEESYPAHLARFIPHWRVVNGGHPYMDSSSLLATFAERLDAEKPRIVIVSIGYNNQFHGEKEKIEGANLFSRLRILQFLKIGKVNLSPGQHARMLARIPAVTFDEIRRASRDGAYAPMLEVFTRNQNQPQKVVDDPGTDSSARLAKGLAWLMLGEGRPAEPLLQSVLQESPESELARMGVGYLAIFRHELVLGFAKVPFDVENGWLQTGMAVVLSDRGEREKAESLLRSVIAKDPNYIVAYRLLAHLQLQTGQTAQARKTLDRALVLDPQNNTLHWLRGEACLAGGDWPAAKASFDFALQNKVAFPSFYTRMRRFLRQAEQDPNTALWGDGAVAVLQPGGPITMQFAAYAREKLAEQQQHAETDRLADDIRAMAAIARAKGVKLVLSGYPSHFNREEYKDVAAENNLSFVDLSPTFEEQLGDQPYYSLFRSDGHCTGQGYRLMARSIAENLRKDNFLGDLP